MPANEGGLSIYDDDLAVIPKIELKPVPQSLSSIKGANIDPCGTEFSNVGFRKGDAPDFIVEKVDLHSVRCLFQQGVFQAVANAIVFYDEKLHENVILRRSNRFDHGIKGGLTIDE